jgi:hypothetical protein
VKRELAKMVFSNAAAVLALFVLAPSGALATTVIGNTPPWNGSTITSGFGYGGPPNYFTPTYGQTVTVPATDTKLDSFTFYVDLPTNLIFRGEVYAWDPTTVDPSNPYALGSATGPALYESGQMQTTSYGSGSAIQPITFNIPGGLPLTAGAQYVLFFTTSRDYAANAGVTANGFVGYTPTDTYSGGDWVYISDGGDVSQWTTVGWWHPALFPDIFFQDDLAFQAIFSSPRAPLPAPASGTACNGVYDGTFQGNLTVSAGQNCVFVGGTVKGNVTLHGGNLSLTNTTVTGNVQIQGGGTFSLASSAIDGDLQIQNIPAGSAQDQICGTNVKGNLTFHNNGTAVAIGTTAASCPGDTIGNDLQINNNTAAVQVFDDTAGGNLQCGSNSSITGSGDTAKSLQGQCAGF